MPSIPGQLLCIIFYTQHKLTLILNLEILENAKVEIYFKRQLANKHVGILLLQPHIWMLQVSPRLSKSCFEFYNLCSQIQKGNDLA